MRILFLALDHPPTIDVPIVSGEVKNPFTLSTAMRNAGHAVTVASAQFMATAGYESTAQGQHIVIKDGRGIGPIRYLWRAANVCRALLRLDLRQYDVIHSHAAALSLGAHFARRIARRTIPLVTTAHGTNLPEAIADSEAAGTLRERLRRVNAHVILPIDRWAFRRSNAVISVSMFQVQEMIDIYKLERDRVHVINNGISASRYRPLASGGLDQVSLLFVGRWVPKKGLSQLIDAFHYVLEDFPNATLRIVGGDTGFDTVAEDIRRQIENSSARSRIELLGSVPEVDLPSIYQNSTLAVFPSSGYESLPTVTLEAAMCKIPFIATAAWGTLQTFSAAHPGLIRPASDSRELASHIVRLLASPEARQQAIDMQSDGLAGFRIETILEQHIHLFENLLRSSND